MFAASFSTGVVVLGVVSVVVSTVDVGLLIWFPQEVIAARVANRRMVWIVVIVLI